MNVDPDFTLTFIIKIKTMHSMFAFVINKHILFRKLVTSTICFGPFVFCIYKSLSSLKCNRAYH